MHLSGPSTRRTMVTTVFLAGLLCWVGVAGHEHGVVPDTATQTPIAETMAASPAALPQAAHLEEPDALHGIYITGWTAGAPAALTRTLSLFDGGVLNAVVIDIKDATGRLSYEPLDPDLAASGVGTRRIRDLPAVITAFHDRGVYVIGRVSVFEDAYYATLHPDETFTDVRTGNTWTDHKGIAWLRPDSTAVETYVEAIARDAHAQGFDEVNLDYVRFPSDGDLRDLDMRPFSEDRADTMRDFFRTVYGALHADQIPVSADVFGLTMSATDDMGIGQIAGVIAPSVDVLAPMVYPSHFADGTYGVPVPATEPYTIIHQSLSDGIGKLAAVGIPKDRLRPWLQDFDLLGVPYTPEMVRAQIKAAEDLGITSWIFWDPANRYTKDVFVSGTVEDKL